MSARLVLYRYRAILVVSGFMLEASSQVAQGSLMRALGWVAVLLVAQAFISRFEDHKVRPLMKEGS